MKPRDNRVHHGPLPVFWETDGRRYAKRAYGANPKAVIDIYRRVSNGESLQSIADEYAMYTQSIRNLIVFEANHTAVIVCSKRMNRGGRPTLLWLSAVLDCPECGGRLLAFVAGGTLSSRASSYPWPELSAPHGASTVRLAVKP
jgi:hypothetical protein